MIKQHILAISYGLFSLLLNIQLYGQCPISKNDLSNGGAFSGNCTLDVGNSVLITGTVNWNGGTMTIQGNDGNVIIADGGIFNINSGTVFVDSDGGGGAFEVKNNGLVKVAPGAVLETEDDEIIVQSGGELNIDGTVIGGTDVKLFGRVEINGTLNVIDNIVVSGLEASVTLHPGGLIKTDFDNDGIGDFNISDGSQLLIMGGGELEVGNNLNLEDEETLVTIDGTIRVENDLQVETGSILTGEGTIDEIGGTLEDNSEGPFSACTSFPCGSTLLPMELLSFRAEIIEEDKVQLKWETASENNNDYVVIERAGADLEFLEIGRVKGYGTQAGLQQYSLIDQNPHAGTNYYRLRQVDLDGQTTLHPVVEIQLEHISGQSLNLFPNPAKESLQIQWALALNDFDNQEYNLRLFNSKGQLLLQKILTDKVGIMEIPVENLSNGVYTIRLSAQDRSIIKKFIKH